MEACSAQRDCFPFEALAELEDAGTFVPSKRGTFGEALNALEQGFATDPCNQERFIGARIVTGCLNYKIDHPESEDCLKLITAATEVASAYYRGTLNWPMLSNFVIHATSNDGGKLMQSRVSPVHDTATQSAATPSFCLDSAHRITKHFGRSKDLLIIALANGGILPAIQTNIYLEEMSGGHNTLYPVRFSTHKASDTAPQLSTEEREHLRTLAEEGMTPVIIDDDVATGKSIEAARIFFRGVFDQAPPAFVSLDVCQNPLSIRPPRLSFTHPCLPRA